MDHATSPPALLFLCDFYPNIMVAAFILPTGIIH